MSDVIDEIDREVKENPVLVYMKGTPRFPMCGFSAATVEILNEIGVPFKAIDILSEGQKLDGIKAYSSWPTIPQLSSAASSSAAAYRARAYAKGELVDDPRCGRKRRRIGLVRAAARLDRPAFDQPVDQELGTDQHVLDGARRAPPVIAGTRPPTPGAPTAPPGPSACQDEPGATCGLGHGHHQAPIP